MNSIPCVVLAGGRAKPEMEAVIGHSNRALALFRGKTLLCRVVDALREADPQSAICVVGNVPEDVAYKRRPDSGEFVGNVLAGVREFEQHPFVLITTSDLPFLTGAVVADLVRQSLTIAQTSGADVLYPVVPVAACYARFPGVKRTAVRLKEGAFTGGNLMLVRPAFVLQREKRLGDLYAARKHPFRLALMLGLGTVARLALAQTLSPAFLSIPQLERSASRLLDGTARALICDMPEIATDLDRPSDFSAVSGKDLT